MSEKQVPTAHVAGFQSLGVDWTHYSLENCSQAVARQHVVLMSWWWKTLSIAYAITQLENNNRILNEHTSSMTNTLFLPTFLIGTESFGFDEISISTLSISPSSCSRTSRARFMERCCMKFSKHHWVEYPVSTHWSYTFSRVRWSPPGRKKLTRALSACTTLSLGR